MKMEKFAYIGCRTTKERKARGKGISVYKVDGDNWELVQILEGQVNPSYLCLNKAQDRLYSIHGDFCQVSAFKIRENGTLEYLNTVKTYGTNPVHLTLDPEERWLYVANLQTGSVSVIPVLEDGSLGKLHDLEFISGNGGPGYISHPHQTMKDRSGRWLVVPSQGRLQGVGKLTVFAIDEEQGSLKETFIQKGRTGAEPRHCVFHPGNKYCYCVNEKDSTVAAYDFDEKTEEYFKIHNRPDDYKKMVPGNAALYDGIVEIDLDTIVPMIALPFHPSNAYPLADVIAEPEKYLSMVEEEAKRVFENNPDIHLDLLSKIHDGKIKVDQGAIAGCAAGSFENICAVDTIAKKLNKGLGTFPLNIYPASQPIMYELNKAGVLNDLMTYGVRVKTAFCGPCFGASDAPGNNDFCIRHSTRNFPNREGSNPATGQIASVALMDSKSIAATAFNGGYLTSAEDVPVEYYTPEYHFNSDIYKNIVYNGYKNPKPETEIVYGPSIKDWPKMVALTDNLLLQVASVIRDEVTTTDELIPSGETASYRSNPYKISEFTLIRKDPHYVGNAKAIQEYETARRNGDAKKTAEVYEVLKAAGVTADTEELMKTTGIGSVLYAKRPGDGSAREYAASCQKVLGGLANICIEYATKRYRSNCVNWGILPFTNTDKEIVLEPGEYVYLPGIRKAVEEGATKVTATVIGTDGSTRPMELELKNVTEAEKKVLLAGSLINFYKEEK